MPRFNMTATSDDSMCIALFDPGTLGLLRNRERFDQSIESGRLLAFSKDADGGAVRFCVFVEEAISVELARRGGLRQEGILHVPSGRLLACDADNLDAQPHLRVKEPESSEISLEPGSYRVEAFQVEWEGDRERVILEFMRRRSKGGRVALRFLVPISGIVALMTIVNPIIALLAVSRMRTQDSLPGYIVPLGVVNAVLLLGIVIAWRLPSVRRASLEQLRIEREFPDFVVRLTRTEDADSTLPGIRCGSGFPAD